MTHILVVDDDPHIREVICFALEKAGMTTDVAANGVEALHAVAQAAPHLIVLDVGMPEMDGLEVCRRLRRQSDVPILFLSAKDDEIDRILGLELGGDDYVTKPFSPRELVTRINVILRRTKSPPAVPPDGAASFAHGAFTLDEGRHEAWLGGRDLGLTAREFLIMRALVSRPGRVLERGSLMDAAYDHDVHVSDRTIDSHVRNIRAKFAAAGCGSAIETVHGVGFRIGRCEAGA